MAASRKDKALDPRVLASTPWTWLRLP